MRDGSFEITLEVNGSTLRETYIEEKSYVHAESESEYAIRVEVFKSEDGDFPAPHMRIGVYVDDVSSRFQY